MKLNSDNTDSATNMGNMFFLYQRLTSPRPTIRATTPTANLHCSSHLVDEILRHMPIDTLDGARSIQAAPPMPCLAVHRQVFV